MTEETIKVITYTKIHYDITQECIDEIQQLVPEAKISLIGSLAMNVPGKEEVDILVEVKDVEETLQVIKEKLSYHRWPEIINGEGFMRKRIDGFIIELHVTTLNSSMAKFHKKVVQTIIDNTELQRQYTKEKLTWNELSKEEYKKKKSQFIKEHIL